MVYRVVSTKLTEEEHTKLLDECNRQGCTPSAMLKKALTKIISPDEPELKRNPKDESTMALAKYLGIYHE